MKTTDMVHVTVKTSSPWQPARIQSPRLLRLQIVVSRNSGVTLGKSKGLELNKHPSELWLKHTNTHTHTHRQTNTHTYQELLSVHKHVILGNVDPVPGQSQDQLVEGRLVCA